MKKVLALVVAFALCFTAVAGCFAVSATAPVISIVVADTSFDISGTNYTAKIAQITELTVQNGLAVVDIYNGDAKLVEYTPELDDEDEPDFDWVRSTDEDGNTVIKFLNVIEADQSFTYTVNVNVENAQPGDYAITATIEAGDYEAEEIIDVADASATFTVEAPHTCAPYGDAVVENKVDATCTTDGSYDSVVYCECGEVYSSEKVTVPATGHTDGEVVEENKVAATCTTDGSYDTVVYCSVCEAEVSRTTVPVPATGHTAAEPVEEDGFMVTYCSVCGAEIDRVVIEVDGPNETSATYNHNLSLEAGLKVNIYLLKTDDWASCDNLYMEVKSEDYSSGSLDYDMQTVYVTSMDAVTIGGKARYQFVYSGIDAKEIASRFTATVYGVDENGEVVFVSDVDDNYSVLDYCVSQFGKTNEGLKYVLGDLLNYGAAAQTAFNYRTDTLVNEMDEVKDYVALYAGKKDYPEFTKQTVQTDDKIQLSNALNCESVLQLVCAVKKTDVASNNFNDLKFVLSYGGTDYEIPSSKFSNVSNDSYYRAYYDGLLATQFSEDITIKLCEGDTQISETRIYSVEAYCVSQLSKPATTTEDAALYTMILRYGYTCANYF